MTREFDKLVRDGVPELIEESGDEPVVHTAQGEEYSRRLVEKLEEELAEFRESGDPEELADLLEVLHAVRKDRGLTVAERRELRAKKAQRRGRFDDGIVLERVQQ